MGQHGHQNAKPGFFSSRANIVLLAFLVIAGFYLATEHYAHVIPYLPWLLLLACPVLHMFMHGGHGGHEDRDSDSQETRDRTTSHQH